MLAVFAFPGSVQEDQGMLVWLTSLVPAFLLAYYRGLRGVAVAVAGGMAVLVFTQVAVLLVGRNAPNWTLLLTIVSAYLGICIGLAVFAEILHRERRAAERLALVDVLTGLPNRRHAEVTLDSQFAAAGRGRRLIVVMYDLDHFKQVNDRHGHRAGDEALIAFGKILSGHTRRMDLSARFGGEEFITVITDANLEDAARVAERVRKETSEIRFGWGQISVSGGLAQFEKGMGTYEVLVAAADRALYEAKEAGRNRIVAASASASPPVKPVSPVATSATSNGKARILVVDDDAQVLRFVATFLRRLGYQVEATEDPEEALRRYGAEPKIDLLITDVMMSKMNGLVLVDRISKLSPHPRVIFMSGYMQSEVSWAGFPGAVVAFAAKPLGAELGGIVQDVLQRQLS